MIVLKSPLLYGGVTYPAGTHIMLPEDFEQKIVAACNGEFVEQTAEGPVEPEAPGAPQKPEKLKASGDPKDPEKPENAKEPEKSAESEPETKSKKEKVDNPAGDSAATSPDASQLTFGRGLEG